jgi:hypothetical protein
MQAFATMGFPQRPYRHQLVSSLVVIIFILKLTKINMKAEEAAISFGL